jgi:hypothetical protein
MIITFYSSLGAVYELDSKINYAMIIIIIIIIIIIMTHF